MNCACVPGDGTIKLPCMMHQQWAWRYPSRRERVAEKVGNWLRSIRVRP